MDPQAFGSSYAREVDLGEDFWRDRLDAPSKRTFIASALDTPDRMDFEGGSTTGSMAGEWIGSASIVGPSDMHPSVLAPFKDAGVGANWEMYALYGMWVHPAHRGKSIGSQLVKACLEWARTHIDRKFSGENNGDLEKVVVVLVYDKNSAGRALYFRTGFTDVEGVFAREEERWMSVKVGK